jgi:uncharacterized membrane protein
MQNMSGDKTALGLDSNVGAMLCYMPICAIGLVYSIIVLVTEKSNKFVRFHAFQSLLLIAAYVVGIIAVSIVGGILAQISGLLAGLFSLVSFVLVIAFIGLAVFGCIKAYQGAEFKLPFIGDLADKWSN